MTAYRIVCTEQEPADRPPSHAHIVAVGTGADANQADARWTLAQVLQAMKQGNTFYTRGLHSGKVAQVEQYMCRRCGQNHIRSTADAVKDNNLDNLRGCAWK